MTEYIDNILAKQNISMANFISTMDELPLWSAPFGMMILDKLQYKKNIQVLDIGFGTGFPLLEIAQRLGSTCKVFGIDPWEEAIGRVTIKCNVYDLHNVSLHTGYAENMPFESNSFDLIVSNNGLNNVFDIEKVLNECFRLMKAGAKLIFTVNLPETMQEFYTVFEKVLTDRGLTDVSVLLHQHIAFKRKSIAEWKQLTTKHHLKLDMVEENQFCFRYADGSAMMKHSFIQLAFMESWKEIIQDVEKEEIFREIEEQLNRISEENGGLVMTIPYACIVLKKE